MHTKQKDPLYIQRCTHFWVFTEALRPTTQRHTTLLDTYKVYLGTHTYKTCLAIYANRHVHNQGHPQPLKYMNNTLGCVCAHTHTHIQVWGYLKFPPTLGRVEGTELADPSLTTHGCTRRVVPSLCLVEGPQGREQHSRRGCWGGGGSQFPTQAQEARKVRMTD